jgi:hypothetical protein
MQKEQHNFHGAEYVEEHENKDKHTLVPADIYSSLEEILADINNSKMFPYNLLRTVPGIKEKLQNTIKSGAYLQKDGKK